MTKNSIAITPPALVPPESEITKCIMSYFLCHPRFYFYDFVMSNKNVDHTWSFGFLNLWRFWFELPMVREIRSIMIWVDVVVTRWRGSGITVIESEASCRTIFRKLNVNIFFVAVIEHPILTLTVPSARTTVKLWTPRTLNTNLNNTSFFCEIK